MQSLPAVGDAGAPVCRKRAVSGCAPRTVVLRETALQKRRPDRGVPRLVAANHDTPTSVRPAAPSRAHSSWAVPLERGPLVLRGGTRAPVSNRCSGAVAQHRHEPCQTQSQRGRKVVRAACSRLAVRGRRTAHPAWHDRLCKVVAAGGARGRRGGGDQPPRSDSGGGGAGAGGGKVSRGGSATKRGPASREPLGGCSEPTSLSVTILEMRGSAMMRLGNPAAAPTFALFLVPRREDVWGGLAL